MRRLSSPAWLLTSVAIAGAVILTWRMAQQLRSYYTDRRQLRLTRCRIPSSTGRRSSNSEPGFLPADTGPANPVPAPAPPTPSSNPTDSSAQSEPYDPVDDVPPLALTDLVANPYHHAPKAIPVRTSTCPNARSRLSCRPSLQCQVSGI